MSHINYKVFFVSTICLGMALTLQCTRQDSSNNKDTEEYEAKDDDFDGNDNYTEVMEEVGEDNEKEPKNKPGAGDGKSEVTTEINKLIADIDKTRSQIDSALENAHGDVKDNLIKANDDLAVEKQKMEKRLEKVTKASANEWQQIKSDTQASFKDLRDKLKAASENIEEVSETGS